MQVVAKSSQPGTGEAVADAPATDASGSEPPRALSTEELREHAAKCTAVAELRVQQAAAQGVPVGLQDLLVDESWRAALGPEFSKPYIQQLAAFLADEWKSQQIFPPQPFIFRRGHTVVSEVCLLQLRCGTQQYLPALQGVQQLSHGPGSRGHHRPGNHTCSCT